MGIEIQKKAFITGVSGGIGNAIAKRLLEKGYLVYGTHLTRKIENLTGDFIPVKLDVRDKEQVFAVSENIGRVDVLINNAGIASLKEFSDITYEEWCDTINVNLTGTFLCTKAFLPKMISHKSGYIVNISSIWGICGASCEAHYSASKAGIIGFTKALAKEMGPSGIRVNAVAPGYIETSMTQGLSDEVKARLVNSTPLMRSGKPIDVADAVMLILESEFITGEVVNVSGGFVIS